MGACVPRWMVEGPKRQRGTQSCQSVLLHPTPRPTPRSRPRPQTPRPRYVTSSSLSTNTTCSTLSPKRRWRFCSLSPSFLSGCGHGHHPSAQHVPGAGQRARPPETLQQESPAHGLDQEKWTLQQPIGPLTSPHSHTHTHFTVILTKRHQKDFFFFIAMTLKV